MISLAALIVSNAMEYRILILLMQYICAAHMDISRKNVCIGTCISALSTVIATFSPFRSGTTAGVVVEILFGMVGGFF